MAFSLLPFLFSLLLPIPSTANNLHRPTLFRPDFISEPTSSNLQDIPPTRYFEVTKPIKHPRSKPCSHLILQHDFGYTYGKSPVLADYKPPLDCPNLDFDSIVLEWEATSKGRQFDRIFGVWLGGVELLRSCTAEPRATGIVWTVEKDITRYYSLLMSNQTLAVYLGNLIDNTYTGIYHVNLTIHFYPAQEHHRNTDSRADLIIPISRNLPLNDGLWFEIQNSTDVKSKMFSIPKNTYRSVLEIYVSFHENDEFWYSNLPNEYINANNLTGFAGNGPFREVVVGLDGSVVGAVWPFTVVYTGGINPLLWRPITGIGSFDLPSYDIEITPFLGTILNGNIHEFSFAVTNALNVWYISANLHLWLDDKSERTVGKLLRNDGLPLVYSSQLNFTGLIGNFLTTSSRSILSSGWVKSSHGNITTDSIQAFEFTNSMEMGNEGNLQIIDQRIDFNDSIRSKIDVFDSLKRFSLQFYSDTNDEGNGSYSMVANLTLGLNEKRFGNGGLVSSLENVQKGEGYIRVKGNLVSSGLGSTQQIYDYKDYKDDGSCYFRNVSSSNYTILYDRIGRGSCGGLVEPLPSFVYDDHQRSL
ncbi:peptide-N4-(N-acetyl-beta-glucosaminyl)asparagine amidase A [Impatiens glandulifera]|uniref:peptide-N4-(N-acetyl-beta- glucosaminyl)asparagine amidase A n=1 Tax=Impatiens glandulifera TaxID=253017 RepID=UPI001FB19665|nr:peptide-N4-(N-acetyl-beta-glucosaminyl)asparagine amidase A [Impatiens glandulifera]